jgi:hypothetical protein
MGRVDEMYKKEIRFILNHKVGKYNRIYSLYLVMPFLYPLYDSLLANRFSDGLQVFPSSFTELFIIEAGVSIVLFIRLIRDSILKRKLYPNKFDKHKLEFAINMISKKMIKADGCDEVYCNSLNKIKQRNIDLLKNIS